MITLFILNRKNNFYWGGIAQFLGDRWKNWAKNGNAPNSGMFKDNISSCPLEYQNLSCYIFLAYNIHLCVQESPKNLKNNAILHNFQSVAPTLDLSLSLFLGYSFYIDIPPNVFADSVHFNSFILTKIIHKKHEGWSWLNPSPPPPAREGLNEITGY